VQLRQEQQRLQTLHAQLEAWGKTVHTRSVKLRDRMWSEFREMLKNIEFEGGLEADKNNRRQTFFKRWFLEARRVRPGLCTITHALCFTISLANLKA
jgi:hypothetical protein